MRPHQHPWQHWRRQLLPDRRSGLFRYRSLVESGDDLADAIGIPDPYGSVSPLDTYRVKKTIAGYTQGTFKADLGFDLTGVVGARLVHTKTISSGSQSSGGIITPVRYSGGYTVLLPSLNLRAEIIPNKFVIRATASDLLGRTFAERSGFDATRMGAIRRRRNEGLPPYRIWRCWGVLPQKAKADRRLAMGQTTTCRRPIISERPIWTAFSIFRPIAPASRQAPAASCGAHRPARKGGPHSAICRYEDRRSAKPGRLAAFPRHAPEISSGSC